MISNNNVQNELLDHRFGLMSYEQYLSDLETKKYKKMSMVEIINADMMIATFGEQRYFDTCISILEQGNVAYKMLGLDHIIKVYIHTYKNFLAVANDDISDEDFLNLMRGFYAEYELSNSKKTGLGGISRFAISFGDNLVDTAKSTLYVHREDQTNFIVATNEKQILEAETEKDLKIYEVLEYALKNDKVIPFYQGIYDNKQQKIVKYEALMRVFDADGKMYPPGLFLEAAKKLKLYLPLSKVMINKALTDFENMDELIGINISLYDIKSVEFKTWLLDRLRAHKDPTKVTIEFVETENYNQNNELTDFLNEAKEIGCKIAVDDFGVGYATYSSIVSLKPDIIKIDGDIIKNLGKTNESQLILESICYMARLIGAKTVAEFVEDENIQKIVLVHEIDLSQGYFFSKPQPFESLNLG